MLNSCFTQCSGSIWQGLLKRWAPPLRDSEPTMRFTGWMVDCVDALRSTLAALIAADADLFARNPEHSSNSVRLEEWS